jgi:hypothetical protein
VSGWLAPLEAALASVGKPVTWFFRDDDAGWDDDGLLRLLDDFAAASAPVDVAVIPAALEPRLARQLSLRAALQPLALHQHGYSHVNHESAGRKCEFGPARAYEQQRADVARGRLRLQSLLDVEPVPIFTPPWNRCTSATGQALLEHGFAVLSRESRAPALDLDGLTELPVALDWARPRTPAELGMELARLAAAGGPVGVMLHHAVMDAASRQAVGQLLALLGHDEGARVTAMSELATAGAAAMIGVHR